MSNVYKTIFVFLYYLIRYKLLLQLIVNTHEKRGGKDIKDLMNPP